ncbi:uroporphyrinogen decarboxylase family protein [Planctomycetota bacterium]
MTRPKPDFQRFRAAITREHLPDRIPAAEVAVDFEVMEAFLGEPITDLKTYVSFWEKAGYDYTLLQVRSQPIADAFQIKIADGLIASKPQTETNTIRTFGSSKIKNEKSFDEYPWIGPNDVYYKDVDLIKQYLPDGMKVIVNHGPIFQFLFRAMGIETLSVASIENPQLVAAIAEKVGLLGINIVENLLQREWVGGIWYGDDMGYTEGLLVSPDFLRKYVFGYVKQMGQLCRQHQKLFILHSDGKLEQILDDLNDCGFHAIHPNEPLSVDIVKLKQQVGDRFALIGNVDVDLLSRGSEEDVIKATKYLIENVAPGGGFALGSGNSVAKFIPLANYKAMLETIRQCGCIYS